MFIPYNPTVHHVSGNQFPVQMDYYLFNHQKKPDTFVYEHLQEIIGSVCVFESYSADNQFPVLGIRTLEVFPPFQRQGLGTALIQNLFRLFPHTHEIRGHAAEEVMPFWEKQRNFSFLGELDDMYYFKILRSI